MGILAVVEIINMAFTILVWIIIGRCILSFIRHDPYQPIIKFIYDVSEPIMAPFRKLIPASGGIDFSPFIAVLALTLLQRLIITLLYTIL